MAAVLAFFELLVLVLLVAGPLFPVRQVEVTGSQRLSHARVLADAGLQAPTSMFAVDPAATRRRLSSDTWIRTASVKAQLPGLVLVSVEEWQPVAAYRGGRGQSWYVSGDAVALGPAEPGTGLLVVEGPSSPEPKAGRRALDPQLLTAMVNIQRGLPGLIGQEAQAFTFDNCGNLTMSVKRGWRVIFGRVLTPEEYTALPQKLAALRSIQGDVDFNNPNLDYVNVMNVAAAAVHMKSSRSTPPTGVASRSDRPASAGGAPIADPQASPPAIAAAGQCG